MATVIFYEKPGCASNARQKQMLVAAGHQVIAKNLLTEAWRPETLRAFFTGLPVRDWFNYSAPAIKNREIDPGGLSGEAALAFMVAQPLLIRRPLMQVGDTLMAGFDLPKVDAWLGLASADTSQDLQSCAKTAAQPTYRHE
ncbi:nitrogenase-associated protein [Methylovulum psychrotolerans]|uniref:ArsC/Spx/MgsR family protein n=1 Tax=Methylovulum psychrotolerans TaxID=1704499 RepID=UPI001BFF9FCD|nr:ArsC/Spx/MgsR family protein [Methylovulum psychrotolerans]MBT9099685.1 nitrogenase-associated protein [Methylovulum psychrotolerans]